MDVDSIRDTYRERARAFGEEAERLEERSRRLGNGRLAAFLAAFLIFLAPVFGTPTAWTWWALPFLALFLVLVAIQRGVNRRRDEARGRRQLNEEALHRQARTWDEIPEPAWEVENPPSFARDLDLFGHASLWKLLGIVASPMGKATLAGWLLEPATPAEVERRQPAVRELAPRLDFRQELQLRLRPLENLRDCETFLRWAEGEPWLAGRPAVRWAARLLPLAVLALFSGSLAGWWPHHFWLLLGLGNLAWSAVLARQIHPIFSRISSREGEFRETSQALELLVESSWMPGGGDLLAELHERLTADGKSAPIHMASLHRLVALSDVRYSGTLYAFVQAFTLWDFHVLGRLERWQAEAGRSARGWLEVLGEIEAVSALAGLSYDHPSWCFPRVAPPSDGAAFEARRLGHPLLADGVRVANDVTVGPPGTFLLVTGSNMSGKSTLIRSLGLNAVLAQAGGPVCAESLSLPPLEVATSVLIEDSLEDGVSFFMAELQRVKQIVDQSSACAARGRTLFYLMDEILRGTNSYERQVAVRKILVYLLHQGAIGAIATHDLNLAEIEELAEAGHPVHFRETLDDTSDGPVMTFDYTLRSGVATTRNALKLLEIVGLDLDD